MFGEQGCGLNMEASTTRNLLFLGNRCPVSGAVVTLAMGGSQLTLDDASSVVIRYLEGGVRCLIRGGRRSSGFETGSATFCGTVVEGTTFSS